MAYASVVSLEQTLKQLLQFSDHDNQFIFQYCPKPEIQSIHDKLFSLKSTLDNIFPVQKSIRKRVNDMEINIRDAMYNSQDKIESFLSSSLTLESDSEKDIPAQQSPTSLDNFLADFQKKLAEITQEAEEIVGLVQQGNPDKQTDGDLFSDDAPSARSSSGVEHEIVGQEEDKKLMTEHLLSTTKDLQVIRIIGMPGIGKTTLARSVYEDVSIENQFDVRAWVTVSAEYNVQDIYSKLLRSLAKRNEKSDASGSVSKFGDEVSQESEMQLIQNLHQKLYENKYLIVIDDMWDTGVWDRIQASCLKDEKKGSRVILTTRIEKIAHHVKQPGLCHKMRPLSPENSWKLMCYKVFRGDQSNCPLELKETGLQISNNCRGLPLSLIVVGGLLYKEKKTKYFWEMVAEDTNAAAAKNLDESYIEILSLSYNHLPGRLKGCFLYMGAFPEDSEILVSKLFQLWVAEGLLTPPSSAKRCVEQDAEDYLDDLIDRNLISSRRKTSHGHTKTCGLHDTLRDLAVKESGKELFFYSIYRYSQENHESKDSQRRLSVHKNILMCLEEVYNSAKSIGLSRSLLYVGPHHHHPLPFCLTFQLLRVLDALTVYFISFPNEIVKLIHLRYLSFTYNGKLPKSISKLRNLQVMIVRRHPKIIFLGASFLPEEIWSMAQLRHLLFTETCFPAIPDELLEKNCVLLSNLQTLASVNAADLTEKALDNMPNLKKLGVWIESPTPLDLHLNKLQQLESFKFTVLNPIPAPEINSVPKGFFPKTLVKLTLSGCGIHWEDMEVVGQLPLLEVLKLREFGCQGPEWEPNAGEFRQLKYLLLESLELAYWEAESSHFPRLERLIIRHCYMLVEIPEDIGNIGKLQLIEVADCPAAVESAKAIRDAVKGRNKRLQVRTYSSWE